MYSTVEPLILIAYTHRPSCPTLESVKAKHPSSSMTRRSSRHSLAVLACHSSDGSEQNATSHGPPRPFARGSVQLLSSQIQSEDRFAPCGSTGKSACALSSSFFYCGIISTNCLNTPLSIDLPYRVRPFAKLHSQGHQARQLPHGNRQTW